ncbi:MAG: hypothetical protein ACLTXH_03985 [Enterobacter hormaechei]
MVTAGASTPGWKAAQSPQVETVFVAPGTPVPPGARATERRHRRNRYPGAAELCPKREIDLTIVGPEAPLVIGVVDAFRAAG